MISLNIKFYKEEEKVVNVIEHKSTIKKTFSARECYTLIKKHKKAGYKIGTIVCTKYNKQPLGQITGYVTPSKDGITVWGDIPSLILITGNTTKSTFNYRASELIIMTLNKDTGEYVPC